MKKQLYRPNIKVILVFLGLLFFSSFFFSPKTNAISLVTNEFPRGDSWLFLSQYGPGHLLETPDASLRVYYHMPSLSPSGNSTVQVRGYCRGAGNPGATISVNGTAYTPGYSCSGLNDPLPLFSVSVPNSQILSKPLNQRDRYGNEWSFIDIRIRVQTQTPLALKVVATNNGGLATMRESPAGWEDSALGNTNNITNFGVDSPNPFQVQFDLRYAIALWDNLGNNSAATRNQMVLRFAAPCNAPNSSTNAFMRWYDADDPGIGGSSGAQQNGPTAATSLSWRLVASSSGLLASGAPGSLGGDDDYRERLVTFPAGNQQYTWLWDNVSATNGIQVWLPFSEINATIRDRGDCDVTPPPPPASYCQITARNFTSGAVHTSTGNRTFDVTQGDNVQVEVFSRNNGGTIWNNTNGGGSSLVYFHDGVPTAFTEGNGRIHKYGNNTVAPFDFNHGPVASGSNSAVVVRGAANTNSNSTYTYTVNHLTAYSVPTGATWSRLATCTINFNVLPPPFIPGGTINSADCNAIVFTPSWIPGTRPTAMNGQLIINGVSRPFTVNPYVPTTINTFGDPAFVNLPLHLGSYDVDLIVEGSSVSSTSISGVPCVNISCTTNGNFELGDPSLFNLNYRVQNNANRADSRYDVALSNPPGGSIVNPDLAALTGTNYTTSFSPSSSGIVTGTLTFNGVSTGLSSGCSVVVLRYPYVKAYGADVAAGGGFLTAGGTCPNTKSGILAYMRPINQQNTGSNRSGSGGQFGSFAWDGVSGANGVISGFGSASLRDNNPAASLVNRLTFGGEASPVTTTNNALLGGRLAGDAPCMPDYFGTTAYPVGANNVNDTRTTIDFVSGNQGATNRQTTFNQNVSTAGNGAYNIRHTYYVNGDVQINGNIVYPDFTSVASIPNFTLVVKGNIYIGPGVTRLDGTYIAQPLNNGTKGKIYTCATGSTPHTSDTAVYTNCSNYAGTIQKLVVNGSFIANKVVFNRALNTLNDSRFKELAGSSAASEVFNFSPEVYLSPPVFLPRGTVTSGDYDSIATLPPIL